MALNKKAYYFSMTVLLLLLLVYFYFSAFRDPGISRQSLVVEQRLQELNRAVSLVEKDAETGLRIATYRALLDLEHNVSEGVPIDSDSFQEILEELLINGSINGDKKIYSENESILNWQSNLKLLFQNLGADATFSDVPRASMTQYTPWHVVSYYNTTIFIEDKFTQSSWNKTINVSVHVPIANMFDPLFSMKTQGRKQVKLLPNDVGKNNLSEIISGGYYVESDKSPGFLQRFQDVSAMNDNDFIGVGIESLVNMSAITIPDYPDRPLIDWLYFYNQGDPCEAPGGYMLAVGYSGTYGVACD